MINLTTKLSLKPKKKLLIFRSIDRKLKYLAVIICAL